MPQLVPTEVLVVAAVVEVVKVVMLLVQEILLLHQSLKDLMVEQQPQVHLHLQ